MQTRVISIAICVLLSTTIISIEVSEAVNGQPVMEWETTYGGNLYDSANQVIQTYDDGYVIIGHTNSIGAGGYDAWLIKTDELGNNQWMKTYGGSFDDSGVCINHTSDGGYIIAGTTWSYGAGMDDIWLVKIDAMGNEQWNKTYGGSERDWISSIIQTSDGGYSIIGNTKSFGAGNWDVWLIRTDSFGNLQWERTFGGIEIDVGEGKQTSDGGYIITGWTHSFGDINGDMWLIKTDPLGNIQWQDTYGGALQDNGQDILQTSDNGFIVTGDTHSGTGQDDLWLLKTDSSGNVQWERTFGGPWWEEGYSIQKTSDGGYIIAGFTSSFGNGKNDMWVIKTDSFGGEQWNETFGGSDYDLANSVIQTSDSGFIIAGYTLSYGAGSHDAWLIKLKGSKPLNEQPVADAGPDQTVNEGDVVWLDGSNSKASTGCSGESWTKYAGNPVLDLGSSNSWENLLVWAPRVIYDGGKYHMWYSGDNGRGRIGYAHSTDGFTWIKHPSNPVLGPGQDSWEAQSVYVPTVLYDGVTYHMWYTGYSYGDVYKIGYANSTDGINWNRYQGNPVLDTGAPGSWDDESIHSTSIFFDGSTYHMWYGGENGPDYRIGYANSTDGLNWVKHPQNPILDMGIPGTWDDSFVFYPTVHYNNVDKTYHMWYIGGDGSTRRLGYATSIDGVNWDKYSGNPVLDVGPPGSWDDNFLTIPHVLYGGSGYYMWYTGFDGLNYRIGFAYTSPCNGSKIVKYEWDFESDGIFDYTETVDNAPDGNFDGKTTHRYGDEGVFVATLRITDDQGFTDTDICNITVLNVDPVVAIESVTMDVEIGLRVAGRKYNDVGMTLYEDGTSLGYLSIERMPGSPDEQMAWIPVSIDFAKSYSAIVTYTPEDPPNIGGNPVWIYVKSENGSVKKLHHTFNVQQSKKRDSGHWNHVEPWEVDLSGHFIGLPIKVTSHIMDPGSDDEFLTYTHGSQIVNITYLNNPPNLDSYPSPEVNPVDIMDTTFLVYEGPGTVTLDVRDDDNVRLGVGGGSDSMGVG